MVNVTRGKTTNADLTDVEQQPGLLRVRETRRKGSGVTEIFITLLSSSGRVTCRDIEDTCVEVK